jgi:hypothetical protein
MYVLFLLFVTNTYTKPTIKESEREQGGGLSIIKGRKCVKTKATELEHVRFVGMFHHGNKYGRGTVWFDNSDRRPGQWSAGRLEFWICPRISMVDTNEVWISQKCTGVTLWQHGCSSYVATNACRAET